MFVKPSKILRRLKIKDVPTTSDGQSHMSPCGTIESNWNKVVNSFEDMNLKEELLRGIYDYGFQRPSALQQRAILPCIKKHNVIVQAQSGIGKTAIFSIAILQRIDFNLGECQALILTPTQELATQIQKEVISLGEKLSAKCLACIGPTNVETESNYQVVVGTPAIISDMVNSGFLKFRAIKMFVLDEVDEMLSRGFNSHLRFVFSSFSKDVQVILLSATMSTEVLDVSKYLMKNPVQILAKNEELTPENSPSKNQSIDVLLVFSKFREKALQTTGAIKKCEIAKILQDVGISVQHQYIDRICTTLGVTKEIGHLDFIRFVNVYLEILKVLENKQGSISTVSSSMSDDSESYKQAKKARIESKDAAINVLLTQITQENDKRSNCKRKRGNGKRVPRRYFF